MKAKIPNSIKNRYIRKGKFLACFIVLFMMIMTVQAQFVHPGITHKLSDLDRVKYMVEAQIDPWYSSYQEMVADPKSSYNYSVRGKSSFTVLGRDDRTNYNEWNDDIRAAYYNAVMWYVTGDSRHADKSVEIFNTWKNLTSVTSGGTDALSGGVGYIMIEAAEIIKSTYSGWSTSDINDFKDMLVYPGYSTTIEPSGNITFYWMAYQGDPIRHGNQGLSGFRTVMAMGIFMDNEIMYDRALRYLQGLPHRSDDLAYPSGPNTSTTISSTGTFSDTYNVVRGFSTNDYGYNEVLTNYIYANGQCQESSRDHQHTAFGIGLLTSMAEMAWNQGDDLYGHANDRLLLGLEYNMRYNVSFLKSYSDQPTHWNPTVASGEFVEGFDRTGRFYSKAMSTTHVGGYIDVRPVYEMPLAHYFGRGFKTATETTWLTRGRDVQIENGGLEDAGFSNDALGWGALTARRPNECYGDPISGFDSNGLPIYNMNVLPMTIEAENFDYSHTSQEDRTYNETTTDNRGGEYRADEAVDIEVCDEGGFNIGWTTNGEWLTYTVYVPSTGTYDVSMRFATTQSTGAVQVFFDGVDKTGNISVPSTGGYQIWDDLVLGDDVTLTQGVQSMRILISSGGFNINNISIDESGVIAIPVTGVSLTPSTASVSVGGTQQLFATISPSNATDLGVNYSSSNAAIAAVNSSGLVTAVSAGSATVTTSTSDGGFTDSSTIIVTSNGNGNLALSGTATQSSNYSSTLGLASNAIDGNTSGTWSDGSVTHTSANTTDPWWEVDLGITYDIDDVNIFNRTNCCSDRLSNFTVSVINGSTTTFTQTFSDYPNPSITVDAGSAAGRIVRVQINGTGTLSLAEVEVYGTVSTTTNNFTVQENETGYCSVDGTVDSNNAGFTGVGFVNTINSLDNGIDWQIDGSAGDYTFIWRYASTSNRPGDLIVNGTIVDNVAFNTTGGWTTWVTQSTTVTLDSGVKSIRLESTTSSGLGNIDYMEVIGPDAIVSICSSEARLIQGTSRDLSTEILIYPNPISDRMNIFNSKGANVEVYNATGRLVSQSYIQDNNYSIDMSKLLGGLYIVKIIDQEVISTHKILKN